MDKYDVVNAVMKAFDDRDRALREVAVLERELKSARAEVGVMPDRETEEDEFALVRVNVFQTGKRMVFEDALSYWKDVSVSRTESGKLSVQTYGDWVRRAVDKVPSYMSADQFKAFFKDELEAMYESKKAKAIDELRQRETEEENDVD